MSIALVACHRLLIHGSIDPSSHTMCAKQQHILAALILSILASAAISEVGVDADTPFSDTTLAVLKAVYLLFLNLAVGTCLGLLYLVSCLYAQLSFWMPTARSRTRSGICEEHIAGRRDVLGQSGAGNCAGVAPTCHALMGCLIGAAWLR